MRTLIFNGRPLSDFETFVDGAELYGTPQRDVSFFSVAGRNGDLSIDNGRFMNKELPVNCFIRSNFKQNFANLVDFLHSQEGYKRFETSNDPEIFRMACFVSEISPSTGNYNQFAQFTLNFNFKPQKWLKSGENAIFVDDTTSLINPTYQDALPLLLVDGTGTITINDSVLTLANNTSTTYIDCEIQDCYEGTINRNPDLTITNGFPVLHSGENTIEVDGCEINIIPRWWRL